MQDLVQRLRERKLVQWALAYVAFAFALLQGIDIVAQRFAWPDAIERILILVLCIGFFVALVLAWYHGEKGAQRISGTELSILALLLAIGGGLLWRYERTTPVDVVTSPAAPVQEVASTTSAQSIPAKSIAVLPFENLSNDKDNGYFVAGMQDLILTKLADIGDLKVISRTSTVKYASHPEDLKTIAQQLGVATILEGSVQKQGNQVLINVQLIDARTDNHIWAQIYTRTLDNVFGVEGDVAGQIATALQAKLSPAQSAQLAAVPTTNQSALNLFLRAEYLSNKGFVNNEAASWQAAIPLYRQAVEQDSNFALAFARLSATESTLAFFGGAGEDPKQLLQQARADAERALQLQPDLSAAHLAIGYVAYLGDQDYPAALQAFAAALKLKPNDADALLAQGLVQRRQGHFEDAIASLQQARTLDPRNSNLAFILGDMYAAVSRYADAENAFQRALALNPDNLSAKRGYSWILLGIGEIPRALAAVQGDDPSLKLWRVYLLTLQRKYPEALALLDSVPDTPDNFRAVGGSKATQQADLYRLMGDDARARVLYAQDLSAARAQINVQQAHNLAALWGWSIAHDEFGLHHTAAGLDAQAKAQAIVDKSPDQFIKPLAAIAMAELRARAGLADQAVPLLVKALAMPGIGAYFSPVLLWLDPTWDPIRHDPRFQVLLQKYAKYKPAVVPSATAATSDRNAHG